MKTALYAGSFDPVTIGHLDIIARAAALCDTLYVAVMHNPDKRGFLPVETRAVLLKKACASIPNVKIIVHSGLLVQCASEVGAQAVFRGVRPLGDFDSEYQMAQLNRLLGGVVTLMIPADEKLASVSSSAVRQILSFGGDISGLVPSEIKDDIIAAMARRED